MRTIINIFKILLAIPLTLILIAVLAIGIPNVFEIATQSHKIVSTTEAMEETADAPYDCIVVLGASVKNGRPSTILQDRLDTAIELYQDGIAPKIVMSGDDKSARSYDEVNTMKSYAVQHGVPSRDVFCDHAGINTYDSMYRIRNVFEAERIVVVTQTYHLYRALYDASSFDMDPIGVPSDLHGYEDQDRFSSREVFARVGDMIKVLTRQEATYLSEPVSLHQSGDVTSW